MKENLEIYNSIYSLYILKLLLHPQSLHLQGIRICIISIIVTLLPLTNYILYELIRCLHPRFSAQFNLIRSS